MAGPFKLFTCMNEIVNKTIHLNLFQFKQVVNHSSGSEMCTRYNEYNGEYSKIYVLKLVTIVVI